ncbi:MAG: acetyltransferase [Fervidobacterium sp.]
MYYNGMVPVYRSLYEIKPFFEYTQVVKQSWKRPECKLVELRKGKEPVIFIHGIDPYEIYGEWTSYKKLFAESWLRLLPEVYGLYIFIYPSLDVPLEESSEVLIKEIKRLNSKVNIYAHSMGGILLRYALQDESFRNFVIKIIFAGTPHIGSPLANFVLMDKSILKLHPKYNIIKPILLSANASGVFIEAPNYKYVAVGFNNPVMPEGVEFLNFAGVVVNEQTKVLLNIVDTEIFSTVALYTISTVVRILYPEDSVYVQNDGLVPLVSATYFGREKVFLNCDHADLAFDKRVINESIQYFYKEN